jgi:hypothetical protein
MRGRLGIGTEGLVRPHDHSILPRGCDSTLLRLRDQFLLDQEVVYLTHGTYGACPRRMLDEYQRWQRELEREPAEFLSRRFDDLVGEARVPRWPRISALPPTSSSSSRTRPLR